MKLFPLLFVLFFTTFAFAQADNPDNLKADIFELQVKTIPSDSLKLPFESIKIIDSRADTTKLGFIVTGKRLITGTSMFKKIVLRQETGKGIENFYNEYYKNNFSKNGKILLISIRKLWIDNMPDGNGQSPKKELERLSRQNIYAKFEYYSGTVNEYTPLKRIDTVFQLTSLTKVEDFDVTNEKKLPFLCFALEKMVEKMNYENYLTDIGGKKKMTIEDVKSYNHKYNDAAILNQPVKKGVFINFDEFKNNNPSIIYFSKRKIPKRKIYEIVDEKGTVILHYFAYYDGEKLAISKSLSSLSANKTFQDNFGIYRIGNSFQFFENHIRNSGMRTDLNYKNTVIPIEIPGSYLYSVPRQIDLETGEVY